MIWRETNNDLTTKIVCSGSERNICRHVLHIMQYYMNVRVTHKTHRRAAG
jgi:hypothetical protein